MIRECNMTCRICLNLTDMIEPDFHSIFDDIRQFLPHQLLIRNIMIPKVVHYDTQRSVDVSEWIEAHAGSNMYNKLYIDFMETIDRDLDLVRVLPHGAEVFHVEGIDISFSDYCIQEYNNTKDIRSLIFLEDGHMYTSWDKIPGSRLF